MSKLRFEQFKNNKTEFKQLKELVDYLQPNKYLVENDNYSDQFSTPVLTPNKSFLLGYTSQNNTFDRECVIIDDFTLDVKYVNFPFMLKSGAAKILISDKMDIYYLYYLLLTYPFIINGHSRHYISYVQELEFKIPSIEEQKKIGCFFKEIDELIELKQTQKKLIMNKFHYLLELLFCNDEYIQMKDIITKNTIKNKENKELPIYSISNSRGFIPQEEQFDDRTVASSNISNYTIIENGMFAYNPSRIDVGSIAYFEDHNKVIISPLYISFSCKSDYIDYLQFYLKSKKFRKNSLSFYELSVRNTLPWDNFLEIKLPLPEKQSYKLIKILKGLIEICNYKNEEINQLQKMKKYYLNKIFC